LRQCRSGPDSLDRRLADEYQDDAIRRQRQAQIRLTYLDLTTLVSAMTVVRAKTSALGT
jgi:hypothetical protein